MLPKHDSDIKLTSQQKMNDIFKAGKKISTNLESQTKQAHTSKNNDEIKAFYTHIHRLKAHTKKRKKKKDGDLQEGYDSRV